MHVVPVLIETDQSCSLYDRTLLYNISSIRVHLRRGCLLGKVERLLMFQRKTKSFAVEEVDRLISQHFQLVPPRKTHDDEPKSLLPGL